MKKLSYHQTEKMLLVTPTWQSQIWYPPLLEMSIVRPLLIPRNTNLINLQGEVHHLIANTTLGLVVWIMSGKDYLSREFQKQLPTCYNYRTQLIKSSQSNYNSSWRMWASWCATQQVDASQCDVIEILDFLF